MGLQLTSIDSKSVWEDFLNTHSPSALFQSWQWGEVEKRAGHTVLRYQITDGKTLLGIAQVFVVKARRGTYFHVRHGPVWKEQKAHHWKEFLDLLVPLARKEGAWFIRLSPLLENTEETKKLFSDRSMVPAPTHEVDAERCWVLDLEKSEEALLMEMRKTTRYEIKQALKLGVNVRKSEDPKDLTYFFELYAATSERHGFVAHASIQEEFEVFVREKKALLLIGSYEDKVLASTIVLFHGGQAIYHHGASISSKAPVSYLVQWEAIKEAKKRGIKLYNFYGIAPDDMPNHPWRGITLFKKGFGGRQISYIHAHDLPISPWYIIPKTIEAYRRKKRGYE